MVKYLCISPLTCHCCSVWRKGQNSKTKYFILYQLCTCV